MAKSILIAVPINEEKLYSFPSFVEGLKALVAATKYKTTVAFAVNGEDIGIIEAIKKSKVKHWLLAAPRRKVHIPPDHVFDTWEGHKDNMFNICLARNVTREAARIGGYDYLFYLDSDGCVEPDAINRLISHKLPVATCMFSQRLFIDDKPVEPESIITYYPNNLYWADVKDKAAPVMYSGYSFGATLIEKHIFERFPITFGVKNGQVEWSEDYLFYRQVQAAGFPFGCDQHIRTIHFMKPDRYPYGYTQDNQVVTYEEFAQKNHGGVYGKA